MRHSHVKTAVDAHQSAELSCSVRGWPRPTVHWFRNSTTFSDVGKYWITEQRHDNDLFPVVSVLNISRVQARDLGVYSCTAHNDMGANITHFNLTVKSKYRNSSLAYLLCVHAATLYIWCNYYAVSHK